LHSFVRRNKERTKSQLMSWLWCWTVLCASGMALGACSDDEPVKKSPYLQTSTRAMLKEVVEVKFANIDGNTDITVDFGDGTTESGKAADAITHAYTESGDYVMHVTAGQYEVQKRIRIYDLLALTEAMKQFRDESYKKVWVMTHRAHTTDMSIPENSVSAVEAAIAAGAEVIECDPQVTKDGVVVVCHDATIDNTTDGYGTITDMTYEEILQYNLDDRNGVPTNEKMPTLEEFLKAGRGKIYFNLDYSARSASAQEVLNVVMELDMMESVFFYCNSVEAVENLLSSAPDAHVYTWTGYHTPLTGLPGNYFVQYDYLTSGSTPIGSSISDGMLATVNMLPNTAGTTEVTDRTYKTEWLDGLLSDFSGTRVCMIQTDVPESLIADLESRGMR